MKARELLVRYRPTDPTVATSARRISDAKSAAAICVPLLKDQAQEVFTILLLDAKHRLIAINEIARGALTSVDVPIRLIIRAALLTDAIAVVLAHNHPSGDPAPSQDDIALTRRVVAAGELFGISVVDHIVVGDGRYVSLKEYGIL